MSARSPFVAALALTWGLLVSPLSVSPAAADDVPTAETAASEDAVLAGHSYHGEAFNEGPRQAAELIPGMAEIDFPSSSKSEIARQFIVQGVAQLHGFWYLEAERSFRQAAHEDPDLAIAYWGMAMANVNNETRARGLIDEAMKRRSQGADKREKLYIEALDRLIPKQAKDDNKSPAAKDKAAKDKAAKDKAAKEAAKEAKQKRTERYLADLEKLIHEFPDDLEAKAFLAVSLWTGDRAGVKLTSRYAVSALLGEIFTANPLHPAHHYRIHLWDSARAQNALDSAAKCGPSSPGIAHMWHMPGHIYSKLKRYGDAAWQQEASARVDHSHMIRTRLMPDQIHNFAHNNEWLIRNLLYVGRVGDALDLSRNLVSLPQHPQYNSLSKGGSYKYGHQRLLQTLSEYGLWDELIREANDHQLPATADQTLREQWLGWLAAAQFLSGDPPQAAKTMRSLRRRRLELQSQILDLADRDPEAAGAESQADENPADQTDAVADKTKPSRDELKKQLDQLRKQIAHGAAAAASKRKDVKKLNQYADRAKLNPLIRAQWLADAGDLDGAIKLAEKEVKEGTAQVRPLAVLVDLLWRKGNKDQAQKHFETLRGVARGADPETPMLARLASVARAAGIEGDWRIAGTAAEDLGERPPLDSLGPFRWQPYTAPSWHAHDADGQRINSAQWEGRPRIVVFYLGFGCLHCVEQLHALAPKLDAFEQAGIELVAISSESVEQLQTGIKNFDAKMAIPLLSDSEHTVFQTFGAWDDFEDQPLHGTFLIDAQNRVRWQDIGHQPFNDADFLLTEAKRLLLMP